MAKKVIQRPRFYEMQDGQVGEILRIADDAGMWDEAMKFVTRYQTRDGAKKFIETLYEKLETEGYECKR